MFVYIRGDERARVLKHVEHERIPKSLVQIFDKENQLYSQIVDDEENFSSLGSVFLCSAETLQHKF